MKDPIERQDAIDAVEHITSSMSVCVNTDECHGMKRMQRQAVIELANLPSAEPEKVCITNITLPEEQIREAVEKAKNEIIQVLPSVQTEIVRCKECKWKQGSECVRFAEVRPFPDDFCSRAERREE